MRAGREADRVGVPRDRRDPLADYIEWTNNRYNPGHYLGGNLPPHLRKASLGPRARRRAGTLLGISALSALGTLVGLAVSGRVTSVGPGPLLLSVVPAVLMLWAAFAMFRSGKRAKPRSPGSK